MKSNLSGKNQGTAAGRRPWPRPSRCGQGVPAVALAVTLALFVPGIALANTPVNQDPPPRIQNSPSITLDYPSGNMVAAYVDDPFAWNGIGTSYAPIGGGPWIDSPTQIQSVFGVELDPSIVSNGTGLIYAGYASYNQLPPGNTQSGIFVSLSPDGGVNFGPPLPVAVAAGPPGTQPFLIKPKIEVDGFPTSPFQGNVYAIWEEDLPNWQNSTATFSWSPAGGAGWSPPGPINDTPARGLVLWPDLAVSPTGQVHAAWLDSPFNAQQQGFSGRIMTDASANGGVSWGADVRAVQFWTVPGTLTNAAGGPTRPAMSYPSIEVDPSNANRVCAAYAARPNSGPVREVQLDGPGVAGAAYPWSGGKRIRINNTWVHAVWEDSLSGGPFDVYYRRTPVANPTWPNPAVLLSNIPGAGHTCSQFPEVAASGTNVYVVWHEARTGIAANKIYANCSTTDGQTWRPAPIALDVAANSSRCFSPHVACNGSNACVVWGALSLGGLTELRVNRSSNGGVTWGAEQTIASAQIMDATFDIAFEGNFVYVVWAEAVGSTTHAYLRASPDRGATWRPRVQLDAAPLTGGPWGTKVCASGTNVYVSWSDFRSPVQGVYVNASFDNGVGWFGERVIPFGPASAWYQQMACNGNMVYVIFDGQQAAAQDIYLGVSTDGGLTWPAGQIFRLNAGVPAGTSMCTFPQISVAGTMVCATWVDARNSGGTPNVFDVYGSYSTNGGLTWPLSDFRIDVGNPPGASDSQMPHVAAHPNGAYYLWRDLRSGLGDTYANALIFSPDEGDIFFIQSLDGGITWSAPLRVNDDNTTCDQSHPWLDIKPNGIVDVVWFDNRNDPANDVLVDVYMAALIPGQPGFTPNIRVTTASFPPPAPLGGWLGDYTWVDVDQANAHVVWTDTRQDPPQGDIFYNIIPNPALPTHGACCHPPNGCVVMTRDDCLAAGGQFLGEGIPCDPNPCLDWADHDVNRCRLTMTDQGILGFLDATQTQGSGFVYPAGEANLLYIGSLWVAQDAASVDNRDYDADPAREWVVATDPNGHLTVTGAGNPDQHITGSYTDQGAPGALGLLVQQHSWAYASPEPVGDFVLVTYTVVNAAPVPRDLYAGVFMDLDLGNAYVNEGGADPALGLAYLCDPATGTHAGVRVFAEPGLPPANASLIHNPTFVYPNQYVLDADKFGFLSAAGPQYTVTASPEPNDYGVIASAGPFPLGPGEVRAVSFAILGGESLQDLLNNAWMAGQVFYQGWAGAPDESPASAFATRLLPVLPNPFRDQTAVSFELAQPAEISLAVYDVSGRRVRLLLDAPCGAGRHRASWNGLDDHGRVVAGGVYYLRLAGGQVQQTRPVVLVR